MAFFSRNKDKQENNSKDINKDDEEAKLVSNFTALYRRAYNSKSTLHTLWDNCYKAYDGSYFKKSLPDYKMQEISNFIFSTVETIKPIMLAENPKILALPNKEEDFEKSEMVQNVLDYEWNRTHMFSKMNTFLTTGIMYGTSIFGLLWDGEASNGLGEVKPILISPFNFFVDEMATCLDDAQYAIYAVYKNVGEIIEQYPEKKERIMTSKGFMQDDFLNYGKEDMGVSNSANNILCLEIYKRDYSYEETVDDELDESGEKTGNKVVTRTRKYPNGRRVLIAGDVLLSDGENPYKDGKFPFIMWKCYDVPNKFWGKGEVENIISPLESACELTNSVIESAQLTANPAWILDKNCGVEKKSLTNRKGLVIRKNPGTEVRREAPPTFPAYVQNMIETLKKDVEQISGVYDVTRGERPTGITAAAAIQALNEQAQGRIKLKVQCMEDILGALGDLWLSRIQQFWVTSRTIRITGQQYKQEDQIANQPQQTQYPMAGGKAMSFVDVDGSLLEGDFDIYIVGGSTMAVNKTAKLQQMIQLAQTTMEDGLPAVDRQALLENADLGDSTDIIKRFEQMKQAQAQNNQPEAPLPSESMSFKDLPPEGQIQMAAKVGIQLTPDIIANHENNQIMKDTMKQQSMANIQHENQMNVMNQQHSNSLEQQKQSQDASMQQQALQSNTNNLQSNTGNTSSSGNTETAILSSLLEQIISGLASNNPQELNTLINQIPELKIILSELQNNQQPLNSEGGN